MKLTTVLRISAVLLIIILAAYGFVALNMGPPPSFIGLEFHDQTYFKGIAEACDQVYSNRPADAFDKRRIEGNDPVLPGAIRSLRPVFLVVNHTGVMIAIRTKHDNYTIQWFQVSGGSPRWQLRAQAEGAVRVLFTRNEPQNPTAP